MDDLQQEIFNLTKDYQQLLIHPPKFKRWTRPDNRERNSCHNSRPNDGGSRHGTNNVPLLMNRLDANVGDDWRSIEIRNLVELLESDKIKRFFRLDVGYPDVKSSLRNNGLLRIRNDIHKNITRHPESVDKYFLLQEASLEPLDYTGALIGVARIVEEKTPDLSMKDCDQNVRVVYLSLSRSKQNLGNIAMTEIEKIEEALWLHVGLLRNKKVLPFISEVYPWCKNFSLPRVPTDCNSNKVKPADDHRDTEKTTAEINPDETTVSTMHLYNGSTAELWQTTEYNNLEELSDWANSIYYFADVNIGVLYESLVQGKFIDIDELLHEDIDLSKDTKSVYLIIRKLSLDNTESNIKPVIGVAEVLAKENDNKLKCKLLSLSCPQYVGSPWNDDEMFVNGQEIVHKEDVRIILDEYKLSLRKMKVKPVFDDLFPWCPTADSSPANVKKPQNLTLKEATRKLQFQEEVTSPHNINKTPIRTNNNKQFFPCNNTPPKKLNEKTWGDVKKTPLKNKSKKPWGDTTPPDKNKKAWGDVEVSSLDQNKNAWDDVEVSTPRNQNKQPSNRKCVSSPERRKQPSSPKRNGKPPKTSTSPRGIKNFPLWKSKMEDIDLPRSTMASKHLPPLSNLMNHNKTLSTRPWNEIEAGNLSTIIVSPKLAEVYLCDTSIKQLHYSFRDEKLEVSQKNMENIISSSRSKKLLILRVTTEQGSKHVVGIACVRMSVGVERANTRADRYLVVVNYLTLSCPFLSNLTGRSYFDGMEVYPNVSNSFMQQYKFLLSKNQVKPLFTNVFPWNGIPPGEGNAKKSRDPFSHIPLDEKIVSTNEEKPSKPILLDMNDFSSVTKEDTLSSFFEDSNAPAALTFAEIEKELDITSIRSTQVFNNLIEEQKSSMTNQSRSFILKDQTQRKWTRDLFRDVTSPPVCKTPTFNPALKTFVGAPLQSAGRGRGRGRLLAKQAYQGV